MVNTVTFAPRLADFHAAALQRNAGLKEGSDTTLRFKTDGSGFAVSWADRFRVRVADFFASDETVAARKAAVLSAFLAAVGENHDEMAAALAESTVQPTGSRQTRLSSRTVSTVMTEIVRLSHERSQQESLIDTKNERAIQKAAYGIHGNTHDTPADIPALATIVDTATEELLADAEKGGLLSADDLAALRNKYVGAAAREAGQSFDALSRAIEKRLREKLEIHSADPRLLDAKLISVSASLAVKSVITPEINAIAVAKHEKSHPFKDAFLLAADHAQLPANDPRRSKEMLAAFATIEAQRIQAAKHVQTAKDVGQTRDTLIAQVFAHAQALAWVAEQVPNGPEKPRMIAECLDLAADVDAPYFTQLGALARAIDACVTGLPQQPAEEQQTAWLSLSGTLATAFSQSGLRSGNAVDTNRFSSLATDLFIARAEPQTLRALEAWMRSDAGKAVMNGIADLKQRPYVDATASDKALIIRADDASRFLLGLQKTAMVPATPTLAEIVDAAAKELLDDSQHPSDLLTKDDLDTLREKYLGTAPKLPHQETDAKFDTLARAVEEKLREIATNNDGGLQQLTPDRTLRVGKNAVKARLRSEINTIALANHEKLHPFNTAFIAALDKENIPPGDPRRSDAMLAAFATIERQRTLAATTTQTATDIEKTRDALVNQVCSHRPALAWVADNVPDGQYKTDMIDVCLSLSSKIDAHIYFTQISAFAQAIGTCAETLSQATAQEEQAAWLALGGQMQALLQKTGQTALGAEDILNFSRIVANFFAATASPENLQAIAHWIRSDAGAAVVSIITAWGTGADPEFALNNPELGMQANHIMYLLAELQTIASAMADT